MNCLQVVEQFSRKAPVNAMTSPPRVQDMGVGGGSAGITIGEALEATVLTAGQKPVEWSDAAAIQAAEVRATGRTNIVPGGVAAAAQSAATLNARVTKEEDKTKLADILAVPALINLCPLIAHTIRETNMKVLRINNSYSVSGCDFEVTVR